MMMDEPPPEVPSPVAPTPPAASWLEVGKEQPVTAYFLENRQQGAGDVHVEVAV